LADEEHLQGFRTAIEEPTDNIHLQNKSYCSPPIVMTSLVQ
jgi:hypothetical protein